MADHGEEARLGAAGGFGLVARGAKRVLGLDPVADVAADALHFAAGFAAHRDFAPGDPARAVAGSDLLVVHAGAVGEHLDFALLEHAQLDFFADERVARLAGERAESVIGVSDAGIGVAPHDQVALRLQQAARALFRLAQLPIAVG